MIENEPMKKPWRDLVRPGLSVIFVGFNPSIPAWNTGHYYANPVNRFYQLLYQSGLTPRLLKPSEDEQLLDFGIGATDILAVPSARSDGLPASQFRSAAPVALEKLRGLAPRAVCCNGIQVFRYLFQRRPEGLGRQTSTKIGESEVFVVPSTSGLVNGMAKERADAFLALATWLHLVE